MFFTIFHGENLEGSGQLLGRICSNTECFLKRELLVLLRSTRELGFVNDSSQKTDNMQ